MKKRILILFALILCLIFGLKVIYFFSDEWSLKEHEMILHTKINTDSIENIDKQIRNLPALSDPKIILGKIFMHYESNGNNIAEFDYSKTILNLDNRFKRYTAKINVETGEIISLKIHGSSQEGGYSENLNTKELGSFDLYLQKIISDEEIYNKYIKQKEYGINMSIKTYGNLCTVTVYNGRDYVTFDL